MEPEQREERVAAMMDDPPTPTSLSVLEKMPTEVLRMIGSHLREGDFQIATFVSKHLRSVFLPQLFKKLKFSGTLRKLVCEMRSLLHGEFRDFMMLILSALKFVTICFHWTSPFEERTDSHLSADRIAVISEFVSKLSSIDVITFKFGVEHRSGARRSLLELAMTEALGNTPQWSGPKTVVFSGRRNLPIFTAIVNQFAPNTVQVVQLPRGSARNHLLALKSTFPSIKGLKADVSRFSSESRTLACMKRDVLIAFDRDFPNLESLVLDQLCISEFTRHFGCFRKAPGLPFLDEWCEELAMQLKAMPRLRRFSFALQKDLMTKEYDWDPFDRRAEQLNREERTSELNKWPACFPTDDQQDEWHSGLITQILNTVPHLRELCITIYPWLFHRGTKTEGVVAVSRVEATDPRQGIPIPLYYTLILTRFWGRGNRIKANI